MADNQPPYYSENITSEGNLTADPQDFSRNKDGSAVSFRIAANYRNGRGDEGTFFRSVKVISAAAPHVLNSLKKGQRVIVIGRIEGNEWTDRDGNERHDEIILADYVGPSLRFNDVEVQHNSGGGGSRRSRRNDDEDEGSSRRSSRRSSRDDSDDEGGSSRRSSRRSSRVETRGDGDEFED